MTRWATLAVALLFSAIATVHTTDSASSQAASDGWITLFDGKNLDQWVGDGTATFKIEDGSVIATDKKDPKAVAAYLVSKQSFKDFEIRAEFWVSDDANSGIFIRNTDPKNISSKTGYEVNIFDQRPDPSMGTGGIVPFAKTLVPIKAGGKWNTYEITAKGTRLTVILNGEKTADVDDSKHAAGPIALQYGSGVVKFRKVQIKPL
jgi:hypothetical protein